MTETTGHPSVLPHDFIKLQKTANRSMDGDIRKNRLFYCVTNYVPLLSLQVNLARIKAQNRFSCK